MFRKLRITKRIRSLPKATRKVNASRLAWQTMTVRMKAAA